MKYNTKPATNRAARLLKSAVKTSPNAALLYAYTDKQGRQTVSDSFRAYRFNEPLALASLPENMIYPDFRKVFKPYEDRETVGLYAPEISVLKEIIKAHGSKKYALYSFGDGFPSVNAQYLLELLETFPDAELYAYKDASERFRKPIYAVSEHGDALLVPVRLSSVPTSEPKPEAEPTEPPIETMTPDEFAERYACAA